jgi:hypothetical protein
VTETKKATRWTIGANGKPHRVRVPVDELYVWVGPDRWGGYRFEHLYATERAAWRAIRDRLYADDRDDQREIARLERRRTRRERAMVRAESGARGETTVMPRRAAKGAVRG